MSRTALLAGIAFVTIGAIFLIDALDVIDVGGEILFPALLIVLGVVVLLGARPRRSEPEQPPPPPEGTA